MRIWLILGQFAIVKKKKKTFGPIVSNFWGQFFMFSWPKNRFKLKKKYTIASALKKYIKKEFLNRLNNHNQLCIVLLEMPPCATSVEWLCIWCLMVSTDQADSHCFYLRISWILMERHRFYFSLSPPFSAGPQKPWTSTASKIKYEKVWTKILILH